MLPKGFLGTRGDILIDIVMVSLLLILPSLYISWKQARKKRFKTHKKIQIYLSSVLAVVVILFELDIRLAGGFAELCKESMYSNTALLDGSVYIHMLFSILTVLVWIGNIYFALKRFDTPPKPNPFGRTHRFWGRLGMILMSLTCVTGLEVYIIGFIF